MGRAVYAPDDPGAADFLTVDLEAALKAGPDMEAGREKAWRNPRLEGAIRMMAVPKPLQTPETPGSLLSSVVLLLIGVL